MSTVLDMQESQSKLNTLVIGNLRLRAGGDRVLVLEDEFRSGYECLRCLGKQIVECDQCCGTGQSSINNTLRCSKCEGKKRIQCPDCAGKGVAHGGIIIPEASIRRPTTGKIKSVGPKVTEYEVGESVIYADFVGHVYDLGTGAFDIGGKEVMAVIRVLRESEIQSHIEGHMELRRIRASHANVTD
jgi:co-chaperonin GroES (HSP10)